MAEPYSMAISAACNIMRTRIGEDLFLKIKEELGVWTFRNMVKDMIVEADLAYIRTVRANDLENFKEDKE